MNCYEEKGLLHRVYVSTYVSNDSGPCWIAHFSFPECFDVEGAYSEIVGKGFSGGPIFVRLPNTNSTSERDSHMEYEHH